MRLPRTYQRYGFVLMGVVLALFGAASGAHSEGAAEQSNGSGDTPYASPASKLLVTGTALKFTVEADHADVLSVLKAIFDQAHRQFVPDHDVAGQVTLRLSGQPFETVLDAVCRPLFLRSQRDVRNIFRISQDQAAIKAAITHIGDLNAQLRRQLREAGLDVPQDTQFEFLLAKRAAPGPQAPANTPAQAAPALRSVNGVVAGSLGATSTLHAEPRSGAADQHGAAGDTGPKRDGGQTYLETNTARRSVALKAGNETRTDAAPKGDAGPAGVAGGASRGAAAADSLQQVHTNFISAEDAAKILSGLPAPGLSPEESYQLYLKQNNLVAINTNREELPVSDILRSLGAQSGVPILIDPSVPVGSKFRLKLSMPPRSLPEALNLLTPYLRLNWRWAGNAVLVTATPDFQVFFGTVTQPRIIYGNPGFGAQNYGNSGAGSQNYGGGGFGGFGGGAGRAYPPDLGAQQNQTPANSTGNAPAANDVKKQDRGK